MLTYMTKFLLTLSFFFVPSTIQTIIDLFVIQSSDYATIGSCYYSIVIRMRTTHCTLLPV